MAVYVKWNHLQIIVVHTAHAIAVANGVIEHALEDQILHIVWQEVVELLVHHHKSSTNETSPIWIPRIVDLCM
jgi:hypothetical protein